MKKIERAKIIMEILEDLFPNPSIPLLHKDPYTLLIAVLLSAQCTDKKVNEVTPELFRLADTPEKMAKITPSQIEEIIRPCGLAPTKAKNIHALSQMLIDQYGGRVPDSLEELEKLPGVGHKTASVVVIQAFGGQAFPVDTHIHRCAERWGLSDGSTVEKTEADCKKVFPKEKWNKLHLQIIYFARTYCPAKKHIASECPICSKM
jgi:endonuclease-3